MNDIASLLSDRIGAAQLVTGSDMATYSRDWMDAYHWTPLAVVKPRNTAEVAAVLRLANETGTPVVPIGGNTGLTGATSGEGAIMLSLERMTAIREIRADARVAVVEAGAILSDIHAAAEAHGLIFPLTFGARGSARIGGALSTNAGGSNVVRYGSTRDLCLGLEVVLPTGEVMDLMSELHKDNSGYDLRHLMIGAEGTLGVITAAVLKLAPKPLAYATAMVAAPSIDQALVLLNRLQAETGRAVEAFEYMPGTYITAHMERFPQARAPFDTLYDVNIMVEVGAIAVRDATPQPDGTIPVVAQLEATLAELFETGLVLDAVVAQNEAQRAEMWARREAVAEVARLHTPSIDHDIAVPLDKMQTLVNTLDARARWTRISPSCLSLIWAMETCISTAGPAPMIQRSTRQSMTR